MNAEQVVEKILSQAKAEAQTILDEAQVKVAAQKAQLETELAEFDTKTETMAKDAGEDKLRRMLAAARMSHAKKVLSAKVAILDDVFAKAKEALSQLPDEQYLLLIAGLMKKAVETGDEEIIVGKHEKRIDETFVKKVNSDLGAGFKGNLRLSDERADIAGGFILSRGKVRINAGSDVLVDRLRESMQIELSQELFST
ncbi:MAG: V-type ATP synthase subunit E [Phycisphaerae bacterium]|nr:V-type ATP synthase subunit E [Phycisphaerae bacterium]